MPETEYTVTANRVKVNQVDPPIIRIIGIPVIGILMPLILYTEPDLSGLIKWMVVSLAITFIEWESSRRIVAFLWVKFPWESRPVTHLMVNLLFMVLLIAISVLSIYLINRQLGMVDGRYWFTMRGVHLSIVLITLFCFSVYEGIFLFHKWKHSLIESALLEKENALSRYEALKNQVNPHFLFNSLNTLSGIIPENPEKAVEFVERFSSLYRYVLDVNDRFYVSLKEELDFVRSFLYLQKIRFGENLQVDIKLSEEQVRARILPLSLQVLIENATKHNEISDLHPLKVEVLLEENYLVVKNNLNPLSHKYDSPKVGLRNLTDRYRLVSESAPYFYQNKNEFIAGIPVQEDTEAD